jgi:amino acid adenylation domain-containing protein
LRVNAPKGVLTERLRAQIAERKQELLEFLREYDQSSAFSIPPILRRSTRNPAPLSFAQERLWFLEQLESGSAAYNICRATRLSGKLNFFALESSLNEIVRRHEVLRSVIRVADGQPIQVAEPPYELKLSVVDLRAVSDIELGAHIRNRIQQEAETPFDFAAGKFLRAELLRFGNEEHILILATHHIVSDAWSMGILTRELWALYEAYANDRPPPLQDLSVQYADFAVWQRNWLQGEVLESQLSYWKKQLNEIPILNLPTDRPRPARQNFRGARHSIALEQSLTEAINDLSHREGVTPFMTLLSGFQVLLYRYSGQEDVVVGSPIANRRRTELDSLIGFFVNTLVLRADLSGNPTFKEALARVREVCFGAYAHQDLPFEKLVEELKPERDTSRNPLFQVMFVLQNATRPISGIPGLRIEPIEMATTRSPFDLSLFLREREGKYIGYIEYSTDLFDASTIERMAGHFRTLLEGIVADPDRRISDFSILTEAERHQLLVEWNDTAADYPKDKCIHELFEEQVEKTPDAIAVTFNGRQVTYRELNTRANQLAHYLRGLGVGPEKLVGICVERSLEMVVGLLGILKAGGAYVPLDPAYPRERLEFMLNDAQCSVLLTQEKYLKNGQLSLVNRRLTYVCLDREWPIIEQKGEENPKGDISCNNLAYVIYTSGSTGMPKGVAIEHRNTVNLLQWAKTVYGPDELAGVLASTSTCFDLSVYELFVPVTSGGTVILTDNALCLHELAAKHEVTLVNTVPSVMAEMLELGSLPESTTVVNLAGEQLKAELVARLYQGASVEKVYDLYGPSETTTYSTFTLRTKHGPTTIGRPIANTHTYILDCHLQPLPMGVRGELYVGGAGVARGYLNRPELTAERFICNPVSDDPDSRLYRTGDFARYLRDGNIEFLGRADNQIKIRGYRIESGEIEAALNQHPGVRDSVIVVRARSSLEEKDLIGYVVPKVPSGLSVTELRRFLRAKLPEYMVPSAFVTLEGLALTPNGKIDQKALPLPDATRPELKEAYGEPRTQVEELLAQIWGEVLKIDAVGVHDNFFELGGHSLLAIQIISRVRQAFDKDVPLSIFFDTPTVAGLSTTIEKTISGITHDLPPIVRVPRDGPLPLSMNQKHLWRLNQMMPGGYFLNMPYVYQLRGNLNVGALERALKELVRRHEALRTVFGEIAGEPVQIIKNGLTIQLDVCDFHETSVDESSQRVASMVLEERETCFDLTKGPLMRVKVIQLTDSKSFLLLTLHHIICDHWSIQIIQRELAALYESFIGGRSPSLAEPGIQLTDYAVWERRLLEEGLFTAQMDFWKLQLTRPAAPLAFQQTRAEKKNRRSRGSLQPIEFDVGLFAGIKELAKRENCTPFMIIVAALSIVLYQLSGQRDIRIGTLVANRRWKNVEFTVGYIMNTIVLCLQVGPNTTFAQLLKTTRDIVLAAFARQELPFEELAHAFELEGNSSRSSLFQVLLNYNVVAIPLALTGLTIAPFDTKQIRITENIEFTTLELMLNLTESPTKLTGTVNLRIENFKRSQLALLNESLIGTARSMVADTDRLIPEMHQSIRV